MTFDSTIDPTPVTGDGGASTVEAGGPASGGFVDRLLREHYGRIGGGLPTRIGVYAIESLLGAGGFGFVYRARDLALNRRVALKVLRPELARSEGARARFLVEARAAGRLAHPNIVAVYEQGEADGVPYIAARLCEGPTLHAWLAGQSSAPAVDQAARLVRELARAVHYAHEQGVLHRDLKPANVLLEAVGGGDAVLLPLERLLPLVADFGLAKVVDEVGGPRTESGMALGTAPYMAPEQVRGKGIGRGADVYALGTILYEVLTLRAPFGGESAAETYAQILNDEPIRPRLLRGAVSRGLETVCLKCLEKEPGRRYASAAELADELDRVLDRRPVLARRASWARRGVQLARRRPVAAVSIGCVALLVAATIGNLAWTNRRLRTVNEEVRAARAVAEAEAQMSWRRLVVSAMNRAGEDLERGQVERAQDALDRVGPRSGADDSRGFAWELLDRRAHREIEQFRGGGGDLIGLAVSGDGRMLVAANRDGGLTCWDVVDRAVRWRTRTGSRPVSLRFVGRDHAIAVALADAEDLGATFDGLTVRDASTGLSLAELSWPAGGTVQRVGRLVPAGLLVTESEGESVTREAYWSLDAPGQPRMSLPWGPARRAWAFSADGRLVATQEGADVVLWDGVTGEVRKRGRIPPTDRIRWFEDAGDLVVVRFEGSGALARASSYRWDFVRESAPTGACLSMDHDSWKTLPIPPLGLSLCATADGQVSLVDLSRSRTTPLFRIEPGDAWRVRFGFSRDGRWLATSYATHEQLEAGPVRLWDLAAGVEFRSYPGSLDQPAGSMEFDPEGKTLYLSGKATVRAWRFLEPAGHSEQVIEVSSDEVWSVAFSPDGRMLATGSDDGHSAETIALWDAEGGERVGGWEGGVGTVAGLAFSTDGEKLAIGGLAGSGEEGLKVWELGGGADGGMLGWADRAMAGLEGGAARPPRAAGVAPGAGAGESGRSARPTGRLRAVAYRPDGRWVAAGGDSGEILVRDTRDGREVARLVGHEGRVRGLAFRVDGQVLASAAHDGSVRLWDVAAGRLMERRPMPGGIVARVVWGHDGKLWALGEDGDCLVWDRDGLEVARFAFGSGRYRALAISPDGKTVAVGGEGGVVSLRDPVIGDELMRLEVGAQVNDLAFSPDGRTLVAAGHDGVVRVWRVGARGK